MARIRSFKYAGTGIWSMLKSQHNAWIHAIASGVVIAAAFWFQVTTVEWCLLLLAIMAVWTAEGFNTALEFLADASTPDYHPLVGKAKDVAAGAVLISAIGSLIIGVIVFYPYLF
ncbi:diacylglycerol kinase family protein [candidate division KSB1 bacterium]|nr:diacylglycerol kinase family protein [candidate division KSB1 bacterium]